MESMESEILGNTKPKSRLNQAKRWCFTLNNYTKEEYANILESLESEIYIIGEEIGNEKGIEHLQGYIEFKKSIRPTELGLTKRIHWEVAKGNQEQNIKYCSKDGKYTSKGLKVKKPLKCLSDNQLRPWQLEIVDIVKNEPDDRTIYWYWEPTGNVGKTTFSKYLSIKYGATPIEGKKNDILYCAAEHESDIYIMDLERSMEEYVSYAAIEKIKNGYYMCSKYESKPIIRNPPHLIIFANFEPDYNMLSMDRWRVCRLKPVSSTEDATPRVKQIESMNILNFD